MLICLSKNIEIYLVLFKLDHKTERKIIMERIFNNSKFYLEQIKSISVPEVKRKVFEGKSMITVWLTKLCPANCEHCFSRSNMHRISGIEEKYQFSEYGVERLIKFINDSNNSYVMMSGGGEPMIHKKAVNSIIRQAKTDRIVIVTNGIWASNYKSAENTIKELYDSYKSREDNVTVVLRLSVDKFHSESLGNDIIINIIKVFKTQYSKEDKFKLLIHTMKDDDTIENIAKSIEDCEILFSNEEAKSDNENIIKVMPKQATMKLGEFEIKIGYAKLFFPDFKPDLNAMNASIDKALKVFDEDMQISEFGNPSVVPNCDGTLGLDFWIEYNGNVTTWGNQDNGSLYNIYTDDYERVFNGTFGNIITYSFLDKGYYYRENIVNEINPKAVLRSKVINLRNYTSALLLEEDKTKLYYAIRVIKDYLEEGILTENDIEVLPLDLVKLIHSDIADIKVAYRNSSKDIVTQSMDKELNKEEWECLFLLIKLGHYDVKEENLRKAIEEYNERYFCHLENLESIHDSNDSILYESIKERIAFMKKEAERFCFMLH